MSGPDEMMIAAQAMGADGAIGATESILPRVFVRAYEAFRAGDIKLARSFNVRSTGS